MRVCEGEEVALADVREGCPGRGGGGAGVAAVVAVAVVVVVVVGVGDVGEQGKGRLIPEHGYGRRHERARDAQVRRVEGVDPVVGHEV